MTNLPDDLEPTLKEIDSQLKLKGVPPQGRALNAVILFGKKYKLSMPLTPPIPGMPDNLTKNWIYTEKIYSWFNEVYGEKGKLDPASSRQVAVLANGDIWALKLPLVWGSIIPAVSRELKNNKNKIAKDPIVFNPVNNLRDITQRRLNLFSDDDLNEVYGLFIVGLDVLKGFDHFEKHSILFLQAKSDLTAAVMHLTAQSPNFGQSRYSSLQFAEKFMKGLLQVIGEGEPKKIHDLLALHNELAKSIHSLDLKDLIEDIQCTAAARYEEESSLEQAYTAHKASLLLVRALSSARYGG